MIFPAPQGLKPRPASSRARAATCTHQGAWCRAANRPRPQPARSPIGRRQAPPPHCVLAGSAGGAAPPHPRPWGSARPRSSIGRNSRRAPPYLCAANRSEESEEGGAPIGRAGTRRGAALPAPCAPASPALGFRRQPGPGPQVGAAAPGLRRARQRGARAAGPHGLGTAGRWLRPCGSGGGTAGESGLTAQPHPVRCGAGLRLGDPRGARRDVLGAGGRAGCVCHLHRVCALPCCRPCTWVPAGLS